MTERRYTLVLDPDLDDGGYTVIVPALPGCITQGEMVEQCVERAREAIEAYIESLVARGLAVPEETEPPRLIEVSIAAQRSDGERSTAMMAGGG